MTKRLVTFLALALMPSLASATPYTAAALITDYNPREFGVDVLIPNADNPMSCPTPGYFRLNASASNYQVLAAFLMTQFAQQKPVRVYVSGCDAEGISLIVAARMT